MAATVGTAAAVVTAGLRSVVIFPQAALSLLGRETEASAGASAPDQGAHA